MDKLKPCPFCGGEAINYNTEQINFHERKHRFKCKQCNGIFFFYVKGDCKTAKQIKKEGIETWNRRTQNEKQNNY